LNANTCRDVFDRHQTDLTLFGYRRDTLRPEEFIEVYPTLPGHIDRILQITTALRTRSAGAQGDAQAIRGLLQLLVVMSGRVTNLGVRALLS
jgi:hypothetical protein